MPTSKASVNIFALSAQPQVDYQTVLAPGTAPKVHRQLEKTDRQLAKYSAPASDNRGYSTGTPYPTRKTLDSHDVTVQLTEDLSSQLLGERALAGFGEVATVEKTVGQTYEHTFTMLNPQASAQPPAYDYVEKQGEDAARPNAHNVEFPSMVCESFSVSGQGRALLQASSSWRGSGKRISPSPLDFFGGGSEVILLEDMVHNFFRNTAAKLKLYPQINLGGTVHEVNCDFRDFEFSIAWNLLAEAGYLGCGLFQVAGDSESGAIRGKCEIGDPTASFNFTIIDNDAYNAYDKLQTMASISASLKYEGSVIEGANKHFADFRLLHANIADIDHTEVDGENALRMTTEPLALGQVMPVELVVQNDVSSYATPNW
ncbi:MAG TPA: hypothetical protein VMM38_01265 [Aridibacter sp.]|nr:hypothetical protein [Aridibacter sp.]